MTLISKFYLFLNPYQRAQDPWPGQLGVSCGVLNLTRFKRTSPGHDLRNKLREGSRNLLACVTFD